MTPGASVEHEMISSVAEAETPNETANAHALFICTIRDFYL